MKVMRLVLVAAALCLAVASPLAARTYAWGGYNPYPYPYNYRYPYPNQNRYPSRQPYPYRYQYSNPNPYPYQNQYQNHYQYQNQYPYPPVYAVPSLTTAYGDYTRCEQYALHQANCFVPNASNSPNLGSIQTEPGISIWGNCNPGQTMTQSRKYQCSKTGAGWFPV